MKTKITIKEIAELAKTSKTTVSFYLNGKRHKMSEATQKRIENIVKKYDYIPLKSAQTLRSNKSRFVGVVVGDITQPFATKLYHSIFKTLHDNNFQASIFESKLNLDREKELFNIINSLRADALIIQASVKGEKFLSKIKKLNRKIIIIDGDNSAGFLSHVSSKIRDNIEKIIKNNLEKEIKRVVFISQNTKLLKTREKRMKAIKTISNKHGLEFNLEDLNNDFISKDINNIFSKYKDQIEKTLFWCNNSNTSLELSKIVVKNKIKKNKIHISSFGEIDFRDLLHYNISSINLCPEKIGEAAARIIVENLNENIEIESTVSLK